MQRFRKPLIVAVLGFVSTLLLLVVIGLAVPLVWLPAGLAEDGPSPDGPAPSLADANSETIIPTAFPSLERQENPSPPEKTVPPVGGPLAGDEPAAGFTPTAGNESGTATPTPFPNPTITPIDFFATVVPPSKPKDPVEIMAWVPPYAIPESRAAVQADFGACDAADGITRVGLQFWLAKRNGEVKYIDHGGYTPTDNDVAWWRSWCSENGVDCLLTVYNYTGEWDWVLARSAFSLNQANFIDSLVAEMERHGLDGIDIDLEGIGDLESDRGDFADFIRGLSAAVQGRGKILTVDSFHYIWNAPNQGWWADWAGYVDNIHSMGYNELFEGGSSYQPYSFQQQAGIEAGFPADAVLIGMPGWLDSWGVSSGRGTSALAHIQEIRHDLPRPTGIAIWDLELIEWRSSDLWCEIQALKDGLRPGP